MGLIAAGVEAHVMDRPGGIFVRRAEQMSDEDRVLLQTVARAIITDGRGHAGRTDQTPRPSRKHAVPRFKPTRTHRARLRPRPSCRAAICCSSTGWRIHPRRARVRDHDHARGR